MRQKFVAGNWKMFTTADTATRLARAVADGVSPSTNVTVAVCPPFPYLAAVGAAIRGSVVALGAQNLYPEKEGAFTGEVSPTMLTDLGCTYVIVGHSERRHKLGETDEFINRKLHAGLAAGLTVILCVGERLEDRQANRTEQVLSTQLTGSLAGLAPDHVHRLVLAYEPVWAIGTGQTATPAQAQDAHLFIRGQISRMLGEESASRLPIQYGGSAKPENVGLLAAQPDVDGALVGGASLQPDLFLAIVRAAEAAVRN